MADILIWKELGEESTMYVKYGNEKKSEEYKVYGENQARRRYGICHVETFEDTMRDAAEILFKEPYYGYHEVKLTTPTKLFVKYAHLQAWGGSPGVECAFDCEFFNRTMYSTLKMEQAGEDAGSYVTMSENDKDKSIRLVFSNRQAFDNFVYTSTHVQNKHAINADFYFDACGFEY